MPVKGNPLQTRGYTRDQIDKIGHTIVFLAKAIQPLYKTKLLKLIYLLDEISVVKQGIPFLGLEYKVWQAGPVSSDLYAEFSEHPYMLQDFIDLQFDGDGTRIVAKKEFSDDEFSPIEMEMLQQLTDRYKRASAEALVALTHRKNSLWYQLASENNLLEAFKEKKINTTDLPIDLSMLIRDDPKKLALYNENKEIRQFYKFIQA